MSRTLAATGIRPAVMGNDDAPVFHGCSLSRRAVGIVQR
jgi:hypothetical protein